MIVALSCHDSSFEYKEAGAEQNEEDYEEACNEEGQPLTPIPPISPPSGAEGNWCGDMELCDVCHTWGPQDGFGCGRMFKPQ